MTHVMTGVDKAIGVDTTVVVVMVAGVIERVEMYEMVTLTVFKRKLKNGLYAGITGALRALGRVQMKKSDKKAATSAALRHFKAKSKRG